MRSLKINAGLKQGRGVNESTRQLGLGSMHRCADIHNAMSELTGAYRKTSEQHVDMSKSCIKRDNTILLLFKTGLTCTSHLKKANLV